MMALTSRSARTFAIALSYFLLPAAIRAESNRSVDQFAVGNSGSADPRAGARTGADQDSRKWRLLHRRPSDERRAARSVSAHAWS